MYIISTVWSANFEVVKIALFHWDYFFKLLYVQLLFIKREYILKVDWSDPFLRSCCPFLRSIFLTFSWRSYCPFLHRIFLKFSLRSYCPFWRRIFNTKLCTCTMWMLQNFACIVITISGLVYLTTVCHPFWYPHFY